MFNLFKPFDLFKIGSSGSTYNPLINYDWSTTTTSGLRYLKDIGSTPTYNASMYFGRGAYLNGVDQRLEDVILKEPLKDIGVLCFRANTTDLNATYIVSNAEGSVRFYARKESIGWHIGLADTIINTEIIPKVGEAKDIILAWNSGTFTLSVGNDSYTNTYSGSCAGINKLTVSSSQRYTPSYFKGVLKDMSIFNRALTQSEITQFYDQPELFYAMAQADSTCVLNMPMCETSSTVRNYKTGIDYSITNYTTSVRDNAKNLQYGLQTCKFVRNSLGVIQSASAYLECDGDGYTNTGWIPAIDKDETLEIILDTSKDAIELNGCEFTKGFNVGCYMGTYNQAYIKVHGSTTYSPSLTNTISLITLSYNGVFKTFSIYIDGLIISSNRTTTATENTIIPFTLGNRGGANPVTTPIRLFKVHNKVLTQAEVTKNYNSYAAKGLLS